MKERKKERGKKERETETEREGGRERVESEGREARRGYKVTLTSKQ